MKKYTGTKTVKAEPMSMGEAFERKLLKEGIKPSECEKDKAGYLVEYEGGYQSWSPADVFEKAYRPSETVLDRLHIELDEVKARMEKLLLYIESCDFKSLTEQGGARHTGLLLMQYTHMGEYFNVLRERIADLEKDMVKENKQVFDLVREYAEKHLDKSNPKQEFNVFVVWQCYILGNVKWLLSTTLPDGMYYEVTYNKAKNEFYLDAYKKFENRCIKND